MMTDLERPRLTINPFDRTENFIQINGQSLANWLVILTSPSTILRELARWVYNLDLYKITLEGIQRDGLYKTFIDGKFVRHATLREMAEALLSNCERLLRFVVSWAKKAGKGGLITMLILGALALFLLMLKRRSYKKYDPNSYTDPRHRPILAGEVDPEDQEKFHEMTEDLAHERQKLFQVHMGLCKECKLHVQHCVCPTGPAVSMRTNFAHQREKISEMAHNANKVANRYQEPWQFDVGERFVMKLESARFLNVLKFFSVECFVNWHVKHAMTVHDTRPLTEKHISMGNNRYYIITQKDLRFVVSLGPYEYVLKLPRKMLKMVNVPARDLVVNEDHFRLQRRGVLTDTVNKNLEGLLETMLSVPVCDPTFMDLGANPLRDARLVVAAFANEKVVKTVF